MKITYIVIFAVVVSLIALSVSLWVLLGGLPRNNVPSGIKQVDLTKGNGETVTFDSKTYVVTLTWFPKEYAERIQLKVQTGSGSQIRSLSLDKTSTFYDLRITFKETGSNSVVLWIEKIEG